MRYFIGVVALVALLPLTPGHAQTLTKPEAVGMSSERLARIVPAMQPYVDEQKLPGVVTLVARKGQVVYFEAIGSQNVARGEAMSKDTIFRLYSQSKPITGVAVMILYEEGQLLLTDPISDYLPEFTSMKVYRGEENGCSAPGFLDSGLTVFASMLPRPARRSHVAPERGFDSGTSLASTARCTSA